MVVKLGHPPGTAPAYREIGSGQCERHALSTDDAYHRRQLRATTQRATTEQYTMRERLSLLAGVPLG